MKIKIIFKQVIKKLEEILILTVFRNILFKISKKFINL